MRGIDLTVIFVVLTLFFKGSYLGFGQDQPLLSHLGFQSFQAVFKIRPIVAQPNTSDLCPLGTPLGDTITPALRSSLLLCPVGTL